MRYASFVPVARRALGTAVMQVTIASMSNSFLESKGLPVEYWDHWDLSALCTQKYSASMICLFVLDKAEATFLEMLSSK